MAFHEPSSSSEEEEDIEEDPYADSTGLDLYDPLTCGLDEYDPITCGLDEYDPITQGFEDDDDDVFEEEEEELQNGGVGLTVVLTDPDVLDCPICVDQLFAPIFQCENGHVACSSCCAKMRRESQRGRDICKCPFCDMKIGSTRNQCRGLEKFIKSIRSISCKNFKYGCKKVMRYSKKSGHEQMCPHALCNCPFPTCYYSGSSKDLYHHFRIQHAAFTTPFTFNTPFCVDVHIHEKCIFLQELDKNVIFILSHEVQKHGRDFIIDCVGVGTLKTSFKYKLTAKSKHACHSIKSVPEVYTEWSRLMSEDSLTVPAEFPGYDALLSLDVCIKNLSEFDGEVLGKDDDDNPLGSLQVVLTDPDTLDCSICHGPLTTPIYQCQDGHLACSSCCPKKNTMCPYGKSEELFERCRGLEKVIETVRISCKNAEYGCKETMAYNKMSEHEEVCPHGLIG